MPDSPVTAKFLDEEDKLVAIERCYILPLVSTRVPINDRSADSA